MLVLPITKRSLDMIISGEMKEYYRDIKPYYDIRFKKYMPRKKSFQKELITPRFILILRNGYEHNSPKIKCMCTLHTGEGKKEWGAIPGKKYYVLKILYILEVQNVSIL